MKKSIPFLALALAACLPLCAQITPPPGGSGISACSATPPTSGAAGSICVGTNGDLYSCPAGGAACTTGQFTVSPGSGSFTALTGGATSTPSGGATTINGLYVVTDTGSANTYTSAVDASAPALADGILIDFVAIHASTGASTFAYQGGTARAIVDQTETALTTGMIPAGHVLLKYKATGTKWILMDALNQSTTANAGTATTAANLSGTPALPNGTTATTQTTGDNTTKLATDAFVLANAGALPSATAADQALMSGASTTVLGTPTGVPNCGAGNALQYSTSTHAFSCGAAGGTVTDLGAISWVNTGTATFAAASNSFANATITTTASQSMTLSPTNLVKWGQYNLEITNGSGAVATLTLGVAGSCSAWKVAGGGGGAITLSGASAIDWLNFTFDGTNCVAWFSNNHN